jgi:hypothetical protein
MFQTNPEASKERSDHARRWLGFTALGKTRALWGANA